MPNDLVVKAVVGLHRTLFRASRGRLLNTGMGMPVLALTTTGRTSGRPRTTMLTSPLQLDDKIVVVASKGGADRNPDWFLNLAANPNVEVEMRGAKRTMSAHVADAAERAELWPRIVEDHANYGGYQAKTDREIPVVVLEP